MAFHWQAPTETPDMMVDFDLDGNTLNEFITSDMFDAPPGSTDQQELTEASRGPFPLEGYGVSDNAAELQQNENDPLPDASVTDGSFGADPLHFGPANTTNSLYANGPVLQGQHEIPGADWNPVAIQQQLAEQGPKQQQRKQHQQHTLPDSTGQVQQNGVRSSALWWNPAPAGEDSNVPATNLRNPIFANRPAHGPSHLQPRDEDGFGNRGLGGDPQGPGASQTASGLGSMSKSDPLHGESLARRDSAVDGLPTQSFGPQVNQGQTPAHNDDAATEAALRRYLSEADAVRGQPAGPPASQYQTAPGYTFNNPVNSGHQAFVASTPSPYSHVNQAAAYHGYAANDPAIQPLVSADHGFPGQPAGPPVHPYQTEAEYTLNNPVNGGHQASVASTPSPYSDINQILPAPDDGFGNRLFPNVFAGRPHHQHLMQQPIQQLVHQPVHQPMQQPVQQSMLHMIRTNPGAPAGHEFAVPGVFQHGQQVPDALQTQQAWLQPPVGVDTNTTTHSSASSGPMMQDDSQPNGPSSSRSRPGSAMTARAQSPQVARPTVRRTEMQRKPFNQRPKNRQGQRVGYPQALKQHKRRCGEDEHCDPDVCELRQNFPAEWAASSTKMVLVWPDGHKTAEKIRVCELWAWKHKNAQKRGSKEP
ncbi:hypothetical protein LTR85_005175 [Meristemomyces frigidus]|nr:hypothetical protein LTR85_005175 [Meristemomyces frigidus]